MITTQINFPLQFDGKHGPMKCPRKLFSVEPYHYI